MDELLARMRQYPMYADRILTPEQMATVARAGPEVVDVIERLVMYSTALERKTVADILHGHSSSARKEWIESHRSATLDELGQARTPPA